MKSPVVVSIFAVWLVCPIGPAAIDIPHDTSQTPSLFYRAQLLVSNRDYSAAIDIYQQLIDKAADSLSRDVYYYALARACYFAGDFEQAERALSEFHTLFPRSDLAPHACQLLGNVSYRQKELDAAFGSFLQAYRLTDDARLRRMSEQSFMGTIDAGYIPPDSLLSLVPKGILCRVKSRLAALMADAWTDEQIDSVLGGCPRSIVADVKKTGVREGRVMMGAILPLSGQYTRYGQSILDGARLAINDLAPDGIEIELFTCDDRADNITAAREALALADAEIDVVIGPLFSNIAATVAAALSCRNVPLLVPAAAQAGFTDLSPMCFQLLPNLETVGRGMAQYAVKYRGMKTLAVMTPTTADETTMAEAFAAEARRLGADITAVERFRPEESNFGPFILDIKRLLLGRADDSAIYVSLDGDTLTFEEIPVHLDGMFLPAPQQQLFMLLPQLEYYRVMTSYLGTDEWNNPRILKMGQRILRDPVFYSSNAAMRFSDRYSSFADACRSRFGSEPDLLTALGYDAVALAAEAFRAGGRLPFDAAERLHGISRYEGMSGRITFGPGRSNLELPLFTIRDGRIAPVNEAVTVETILPEPPSDEDAESDEPDQEEPPVVPDRP